MRLDRNGGRFGRVGAGRRQLALDLAAADAVGAQVGLLDMGEVEAAEVADRKLAEDVVDHRGRHLDGVVALDQARRLEAREDKGVDELFQRHAVLQADRDGDGEAVHHAAEGRAFLVHVDEDLAEAAVLVFAGAQVDVVAADDGLLGVACAAGAGARGRARTSRSTIRSTMRSATIGARAAGGSSGQVFVAFVVVVRRRHADEGLAKAWSRRGRGRWP